MDGTLPPEQAYDAAILERHGEAVWRYCRSRSDTLQDAEDVFQDTCLRFLSRRERELDNPEGWLIHAARCACADLARRNRIRRQHDAEAAHEEAHVADAEELVMRSAVVKEVLRAIPRRDAEVLRILYVEDGSIDDAAESMGVAPSNVRVIAFRAREKARSLLEALGAAALSLAPVARARALSSRLAAELHRLTRFLLGRGGAVETAGNNGGVALASVGGIVALGLAAALALQPAHQPGRNRRPVAPAAPILTPRLPAPPVGAAPGPGGRPGPEGSTTRPAAGPRGSVAVYHPAPPGPGLPPPPPVTGLAPLDSRNGEFDYLAVSPGYLSDGTMFASGKQMSNCAPCGAGVIRSTDFGATWQLLPPSGNGTDPQELAISPLYDQDHRFFQSGTAGVEESTDGGDHFSTIYPSQSGRITTASVSGGYRVAFLVGTGIGSWSPIQLASYDPSQGTTSITLGPDLQTQTYPQFLAQSLLPGSADGTVLVGGIGGDYVKRTGALEVGTCPLSGSACTWATLPDDEAGDAWVHLAVSTTTSPPTVFAYTGSRTFVSTDGGQTFASPVMFPGEGAGIPDGIGILAPASDYGTSHRIIATTGTGIMFDNVFSSYTLSGNAVSLLASHVQPIDFAALSPLPDGRLLGAENTVGHYGLAFSSDWGTTWTPTTP